MIFRLLMFVIDIYVLVVIARVVVSWVRVDPGHPAVQFLHNVTEPLLAPIRSVIDPWQRNWGIDLSPLVLLIALGIVERMLWALAIH